MPFDKDNNKERLLWSAVCGVERVIMQAGVIGNGVLS